MTTTTTRSAAATNIPDTDQEKDFRERYALELQSKKMRGFLSQHFGSDELADEIQKVARQEQMTPGRRGEQIKREEISKEIIRRTSLLAKAKVDGIV
ncbi:MAG TPA: hypothetical protein VJP79_00090 [Nitrososphaera sp.]|nr:hypothetical protein [Nitrososphaera sp.]